MRCVNRSDSSPPTVQVVYFPAWDCLPYDRVSPGGEIIAARVAALAQMIAWAADKKYLPRVVVTTVNAALQRVMPRAALGKIRFSLQKQAGV